MLRSWGDDADAAAPAPAAADADADTDDVKSGHMDLSSLHLPPPNRFIPDDFSLVCEQAAGGGHAVEPRDDGTEASAAVNSWEGRVLADADVNRVVRIGGGSSKERAVETGVEGGAKGGEPGTVASGSPLAHAPPGEWGGRAWSRPPPVPVGDEMESVGSMRLGAGVSCFWEAGLGSWGACGVVWCVS